MARRKHMSGGSRLRRQLRKLPEELRGDLAAIMPRVGEGVRRELESRAPKDEGRLASAAKFKVSNDKMGVTVGYSREQSGFKRAWARGGFTAVFMEYGTRHHAAQPFVRASYRARVEWAIKVIDEARRSTVRKIMEST